MTINKLVIQQADEIIDAIKAYFKFLHINTHTCAFVAKVRRIFVWVATDEST